MNFNQPIADIAGQMLNQQRQGVTLLQAMRLGKAIAKLGKASGELHSIIWDVSDGK